MLQKNKEFSFFESKFLYLILPSGSKSWFCQIWKGSADRTVVKSCCRWVWSCPRRCWLAHWSRIWWQCPRGALYRNLWLPRGKKTNSPGLHCAFVMRPLWASSDSQWRHLWSSTSWPRCSDSHCLNSAHSMSCFLLFAIGNSLFDF